MLEAACLHRRPPYPSRYPGSLEESRYGPRTDEKVERTVNIHRPSPCVHVHISSFIDVLGTSVEIVVIFSTRESVSEVKGWWATSLGHDREMLSCECIGTRFYRRQASNPP